MPASHNVQSDEALARRLQAQWAGLSAEGDESGDRQLTDEELAMLLQQQEDLQAEHREGLRADHGQEQLERGSSTWSLWRRQSSAPGNHSHAQSPMWPASQPLQPPTPTQEVQLSDEELARMLQREEDAGRPIVPPIEPTRPGIARLQVGSWLPPAAMSAATILSSGALFGCCGGLQIAACFGLGHMMTWLCAIGGGIAGHVSGNGVPMGESVPQHDDLYSEDTDDSDEPTRGLAQSIIEGHTVGHVYSGPAVSSSPRGQEERKCMVCMEPFIAGDVLRALPCLHRYHQRCIDEWLTRSPECPICKRDITAAPVTPNLSNGSHGGARATRRSVASLFPLRAGWTR